MKTIFITGQHHSGSTILDMILGSHPDCIAVGEVDNVIQGDVDREWLEAKYDKCTCGKCKFWPAVMEKIHSKKNIDLEERYSIFLQVFAEHFPGKIPIDSSKNISSFHAIDKKSDCTVIRLVRDVRGWCVSRNKKISPRFMLSWYKDNRKFAKAMPGAILVGYEPLVLNSEQTVRNMCAELGLSFHSSMIDLGSGTEHILVGNAIRRRATRLKYDHRWMQQASAWPLLLKPIMDYNDRQVYLNSCAIK